MERGLGDFVRGGFGRLAQTVAEAGDREVLRPARCRASRAYGRPLLGRQTIASSTDGESNRFEGRPFPAAAIDFVLELAQPRRADVNVFSIARVHGTAFGLPSPREAARMLREGLRLALRLARDS